MTAYNWRSLSLLAYIVSLCAWSWILANLNCVCDGGLVEAPRCSDRNCIPDWNELVSCQAPLCNDRKLATFRGVSTCWEIVVGTFGTGGCLRAFSSGVCGRGRRPNELNFWIFAVRWFSPNCVADFWFGSNLKPLKFGKSLQAAL